MSSYNDIIGQMSEHGYENEVSTLKRKRENGEFDVFLCHNNADESEIKKIGQRLMEHGILPWLDEWECRPGLPWQWVLEQQIEKIKSAAVSVGKNGIGPWQREESQAFLDEFIVRHCPVIPIILPDTTTNPELPPFLKNRTWVDFRKDEPDPMQQLIWGITGKTEDTLPQGDISKAKAKKDTLPQDDISKAKAKKNRRAVIVGIDKYPKIEPLKGAVNDAEDIRQILEKRGRFEIVHCLQNEEANNQAIRQAIADLLWQTDQCDMALFYFSGHGFVDSHKNGYIAPYDMLKDNPFIYGISMGELKKLVLDSENKKNVLMILDCCYSGISTGETRSPVPNEILSFNPYFEKWEEESGSEGKIILASSGANQQSREIEREHGIGGSRHTHGAFTYYFIEGLNDKNIEDRGIIYLHKLYNYVSTQLSDKEKQVPRSFGRTEPIIGQTEPIIIAWAPGKYDDFILENIKKAEALCNQDDLSSLIEATKLLDVLESEENKKAHEIKNKINDEFKRYRGYMDRWLPLYENNIRPSLPNVYPEFYKLIKYLDSDNATKLDDCESRLLLQLWKASKPEPEIDNIEIFIENCKPYETYLFSWDKISGNAERRLIEFLRKTGIDWAKTAKFETKGGSLRIFNEKNSLLLRLNNEKTMAVLAINDGKAHEFVVKREKNKLNVFYQPNKP